MNVWLFIFYLTYSIVLINKIASDHKKLEKSFDAIFGEGWEEKEETDDKQTYEEHLKYLLQRQGGDEQNDAIDGDESQPNQNDIDNNLTKATTDQNLEEDGSAYQNENGQEKREIIGKFNEIKEKIKQKGIKFSNKEKSKIECQIAKKLGTSRNKIYKLKKEFGISYEKYNGIYDQQKREIVIKFYEIKEKIRGKGIKLSDKKRNKVEEIISKKLGTNRKYIYKWKKELGIIHKNAFSDLQKREIIEKFYLIKKKIKRKEIKYSTNEWANIERIIAKKLGKNRTAIYKWIKELEINSTKKHSNFKKIEILKEFDAMKNEYKHKGNYSYKEWHKNYAEIYKKNLGVHFRTIQNWRKKFGMCEEQKHYKNEEKLKIMKQYWEVKRINPKISDGKIAEILKIGVTNIRRWKSQFGQDER